MSEAADPDVQKDTPEWPLAFPYLLGKPDTEALIREQNADFVVDELMSEEVFGVGEQQCLFVEKDGQNTAYVARRLANYAGVRELDVGYSGLKDRHAVTRQWFSIYYGKRPRWDGANLQLEGVRILKEASSQKKLRRGDHYANRFSLRLTQVRGDKAACESRVEAIKAKGFPNYFGEQRFGRNCHNLDVAWQWFTGKKRLSVKNGGMYLSAARAYLFNQLLALRIMDKALNPLPGDVVDKDRLMLSLFGDGTSPEAGVPLDYLEKVMGMFPELALGLAKNRIAIAHRSAVCVPESLQWAWEKDNLCVTFELPAGSFATSLVRELTAYKDRTHEYSDSE